ncbi:MAG: hypothetical protein H6732_09985 [Alphaproteobacteria bacterium]|nr:hypothetical protein [Alphaproteobacteria bacterium]
MRSGICGVALAVAACTAEPEVVLVVSPDDKAGPVPADVQPVMVAEDWWDGFERTGWQILKQPGDVPVSASISGYDNGLLFRPTVSLVEGGTFELAGTIFRVDPQATGLRPSDGWPSELVKAETDLLHLTLFFESTPTPAWHEVEVMVSADCQLELIALGGRVDLEATACGLDLFPDTITVAHRPVDWNGDSVLLTSPGVVILAQ